MKRILGGALAVVVIGIAFYAIRFYQQIGSFEVERVSDDLHVIYGFGSNVGVLRTDEGAVVVDTMTFRSQGVEIRERAEELGGGPVQLVVNTHYHADHTHGNPAFPVGLPVVSTERTLAYLRTVDAAYWEGDAGGTLPNETFRNERVIEVGGKTLRLLHPGRGHTDGDLVVLFVEDRVLHAGDLFFNGRYPNIDLEAGGSVEEWVATLDRVLQLDFDRVIPGHGPVTDRAGLRAYQRFVRQLAAAGTQAVNEGWSLEEMQRNAEVDADADYEDFSIPFVLKLDREFVLRRSWEEATGNFERFAVPESAGRIKEGS